MEKWAILHGVLGLCVLGVIHSLTKIALALPPEVSVFYRLPDYKKLKLWQLILIGVGLCAAMSGVLYVVVKVADLPIGTIMRLASILLPFLVLVFQLKGRKLRLTAMAVFAPCFTAWLVAPNWLTADLLTVVAIGTTVLICQPKLSFFETSVVWWIVAWIYDAPQVFGTHLMEKSVTHSVANHSTGLLTLPGSFSLSAPPITGLGAGDVIFPALLVLVVARLAERTSQPLLYRAALVGYAVGFAAVEGAILIFRAGQPAMIYLVPAITITVWLTALYKGVGREELGQREALRPELTVAET